MGSKTKIEWCTATWNPIMGCTPISPGCRNCYARTMMARFAGQKGWPSSPGDITLFPERLEQPFRWKKPKTIFVCSTSDLFHGAVPFKFIASVFGVMASNPRHTFQVLTKRPSNMIRWFNGMKNRPINKSLMMLSEYQVDSFANPSMVETHISTEWPLPNVHIGVSAENQEMADERIPLLSNTPAAKRFVSLEPLLGPISLGDYLIDKTKYKLTIGNYPDGVIVGAETGKGKRHMDLDWARYLRDQCVSTNVPFFFKKDSDRNHELDGEVWEQMPCTHGTSQN